DEADEEADDELETDEEIEVDETDQATEAAPDQSAANARLEKLSRIQKACLEFCIALLDHRITCREYDSPLVCALAVLGVKEEGWKGPKQYPLIRRSVRRKGVDLCNLRLRVLPQEAFSQRAESFRVYFDH
ncbi:hypothetical protein CC86DRAFT_304521, partial [Ophiobolus disseminans]